MPVFRINKDKNYTVMSNYHLKDLAMSLKAKGLLSLMLSLPENWDYSVNGLVAICKESVKTIRSTLAELETLEYLKRDRIQGVDGKFDYLYQIYEQPYTQKGYAVKGHTEKVIQLNKDNKILKNKRKSKKKNVSKAEFEQREYQPGELEKLYKNKN